MVFIFLWIHLKRVTFQFYNSHFQHARNCTLLWLLFKFVMKIFSCQCTHAAAQTWLSSSPYLEYSFLPSQDCMDTEDLGQAHTVRVGCLRPHCLPRSFPGLSWTHHSPRAKQKHVTQLTLGIMPSELRIATGPAHTNKGSPGFSGHRPLHCPLP